ncbi:MAG: energy transducer TonB [Gammaproteobacteria bacterium]
MTEPLQRWIGPLLAATVVVLALMVASLWAFGAFDIERLHYTQSLRLLGDNERRDLATELGEAPASTRPTLPPMEEIPPLEIPQRQRTGFVQLEFTVGADGRVAEAEVVRAAPSGYYEEQALAILRSRRFEDLAPGETSTEIIDFRIEVDDGS